MFKLKQPLYLIVLLMLAGEAIFLLPFVMLRIFRPTFLSVLKIDNVELGWCFSVYGVVAIFCYFFGGRLADLFAPRKLMAVALWLTAAGGLYMATIPSFTGLLILFGFWGMTTILLFWAAMIKATRVWGGDAGQGKAFGFLDAGRGLVAASSGVLLVALVNWLVPDTSTSNLHTATLETMFPLMVNVAAGFVAFVGLLVFFLFKTDTENQDQESQDKLQMSSKIWAKVLSNKRVLLMAIIVLCAYTGYKCTDFIAQFTSDILKYEDVLSAEITAYLLYMRVVVALIIGVLADRFGIFKWLKIGFIIMILSSVIFITGLPAGASILWFVIATIFLAFGVFATRALYFTLMEKGDVPLIYAGTAVGLISVIGFLPDVFVGPITGYFLEFYPGLLGFQLIFGFLALFSVVGFIAVWRLQKIQNSPV